MSDQRLYGQEGDDYLDAEIEDCIEKLVDRLGEDDPRGGLDFVTFSVHHPSHHLPPVDILLEWVGEWAAEHGEVAEGWELGGGDSDRAAAEAFIAALADNVTFMMSNEVVARHRLELRGRQPFLDGEPYGEPLPDEEV